MSVKVMGMVWDSGLPRDEKYVCLAYTDHADHLGRRIYPSIGLVAWKTGYSDRQVQRITAKLVKRGVLELVGASPLNTNEYRCNLEKLPYRASYESGGGDILSPPGGDILAGGGDIAMSPKPSLKPSLKKEEEGEPPVQNVFQLYEQNIGALTPMIADDLKDAEQDFPLEWIEAAIGEAVAQNARRWKYVQAILDRWKVDGFKADSRRHSKNGKRRPTNGKSAQDEEERRQRELEEGQARWKAALQGGGDE